ncbi:MAG: chemotaxis protein CheW, partial [Candidatus Methylomirabilis sp.]|nr:chemotaxis protein CheW [Deltaproteobacteria bacterium]
MSAAGENGSALEPSIHAVSFRIGEEELGVDILLIQEINRPMKTAGVPNAPHFVDGLANLRGRVVPILDLRKMLGAACREPDAHARVMILNLDGKVAGFRVDAVLEVVRIPPADIDPAPAG